MAQNYTRQSSFADGDTITAALFNNEFNQVVNAFAYSASSDSSTGHKHDGSSGQGGNIPQIGDIDFLNKIVVDNTNNRWGFYVQVSSGTVEQLRIQDGAIVPVTNNDIDLGTSSLEFKDLFLDGTAHIDTLDVDVNATVAGTLGVTGATTLSSDLSIGGNLTVTGNATIAGNLTFGDAATDTVAFSADVASNLLPSADNTYDLGASGSEWKDLYIDGTANIDSLIADTADINGGTIDGATIATSDITVGSGKTLNVSAGTLTLADNQISGDKVEGGTIAATTITTLTSTTGNITSVNATTVDTTNLEVTTLKAKDGTTAGSIADSTGIVTVASSVLTTTDINGGTIDGVTIGGSSAGNITYANLSDGTITVTAFADEDDMSSDSATLVPTQQSVKAYVDAQVTAQDFDFQGDTGGALSIDLDSETMTFTGGTGIDTSGSGNAVTFAIDSTVTTLTGSQTLTNKSLTAPTLTGTATVASLDISGDIDVDGTTNLDVVDIDGAVDMASTLAVGGVVTANAGVVVDNFTLDGTTLALSSGDFTVDVAGDIILDADGREIKLKDAGLEFGVLYNSNGDFGIYSSQDDKDMLFQGSDAGSVITALTLDMSAAGAATFNAGATFGSGIDVTGTVTADGLTVDGSAQINGDASTDGLVIQNPLSGSFYNAKLEFMRDSTTGGAKIQSERNSSGGVGLSVNVTSSNTAEVNGTYTKALNIANNGDISFYEDTGTTPKLFWDASAESLGIGTTPATGVRLDIRSNAAATIGDFRNASATGFGLYVAAGDTSSQYAFRAADYQNNALFTVQGDGNVGIGTSVINSTLSVGSTDSGATITSGGTNTHLQLKAMGSGGVLIFGAGGVANGTAGTERMRIDASGRVGIGMTANSGCLLNVNDHIRAENSAFLAGRETAALPAFAFHDDTDTGMFNVASNILAFSTAGTERMRIDASGHIHTGYTSNFGGDHVNVLASDGGGISIAQNNAGTATSGTILGSLSFQSYLNGQTLAEADARISAIAAENQSGSAAGTDLAFYTKPNGTGPGSAPSERMRISSAGNVGINNTAPSTSLDVTGTADAETGVTVTHSRSGVGYTLLLNNTNNGANKGSGIKWQGGGFDTAAIIGRSDAAAASGDAPGFLTFHTSTDGSEDLAERMRIDSSGNVGIGITPTRRLDVYGASGAVARITGPNAYNAESGLEFSVGRAKISGVLNGTGGTPGTTLRFYTMPDSGSVTEAMRIDSSGSLLVGTTDASIWNNTTGNGINLNGGLGLIASARTNAEPLMINRMGTDGEIIKLNKNGATVGEIGVATNLNIGSGGTRIWFKDDTKSLRPISTAIGNGSDGIISIGEASGGNFKALYLKTVDGTAAINTTVATAINYNAASFTNSAGTQVGRILANNAGTTQYITSSDQRLKENIAAADDAGSKIDAIQVRKFDWKSDGSHQDFGMIAQELQAVAPEAVAGDPESEEVMGVDYSKLVPMMLKEIQSLRARIAALES